MIKHSSRQFGDYFSGFGRQSEKFSRIGACIRRNFTPCGPTARPGVSGRIARFVLRLISHDIIIFFNLLLISHTLLLELMVCGLVATVTRVF